MLIFFNQLGFECIMGMCLKIYGNEPIESPKSEMGIEPHLGKLTHSKVGVDEQLSSSH